MTPPWSTSRWCGLHRKTDSFCAFVAQCGDDSLGDQCRFPSKQRITSSLLRKAGNAPAVISRTTKLPGFGSTIRHGRTPFRISTIRPSSLKNTTSIENRIQKVWMLEHGRNRMACPSGSGFRNCRPLNLCHQLFAISTVVAIVSPD